MKFLEIGQNLVQDAKPKVMVTLNQKEDSTFAESAGAGFNVKHVLCEQQLTKVWWNKLIKNGIFQESTKFEPVLDVEAAQKDDVACNLYTSGTTGLLF